jgi:hypothetical protein
MRPVYNMRPRKANLNGLDVVATSAMTGEEESVAVALVTIPLVTVPLVTVPLAGEAFVVVNVDAAVVGVTEVEGFGVRKVAALSCLARYLPCWTATWARHGSTSPSMAAQSPMAYTEWSGMLNTLQCEKRRQD